MPVSLFPLLLPSVFGVLLVAGALRGRRSFVVVSGLVLVLFALVVLPFYVSGWLLMVSANRGDAEAMYQLARWHENHSERIGAVILWPFPSNTQGGYAILEKAALMGSVEATYALGVRLKHGQFVPRPPGWHGATGNWFPQPERGQALIDQALESGYEPSVKEEEEFYWRVFRGD